MSGQVGIVFVFKPARLPMEEKVFSGECTDGPQHGSGQGVSEEMLAQVKPAIGNGDGGQAEQELQPTAAGEKCKAAKAGEGCGGMTGGETVRMVQVFTFHLPQGAIGIDARGAFAFVENLEFQQRNQESAQRQCGNGCQRSAMADSPAYGNSKQVDYPVAQEGGLMEEFVQDLGVVRIGP